MTNELNELIVWKIEAVERSLDGSYRVKLGSKSSGTTAGTVKIFEEVMNILIKNLGEDLVGKTFESSRNQHEAALLGYIVLHLPGGSKLVPQ
jgi:small nuclear ribonucleoprotein (snRNP)-like protein